MNPVPKHNCKQIISFLYGNETYKGRIVEVTLFRRENSIGYGVESLDKRELVYIGEEQICV